MRSWDAFIGLEQTVKNMLTSLRAVGELRNPSIRDRHWEQLVVATKVTFVMSDDTYLADLLALNLHNFEDEVHNIVDKAIKEMAMEKMLRDLNNVWSVLEFKHETHVRTGYTLLRLVGGIFHYFCYWPRVQFRLTSDIVRSIFIFIF